MKFKLHCQILLDVTTDRLLPFTQTFVCCCMFKNNLLLRSAFPIYLSTDNLWRHNQHTYKIAIFFFPGLSQNFILVRWFLWWMNPTRTKNSKLLNEHLIALRWKIHWYKSFFHSRYYFMNTRILRKIRKTKIVIILPVSLLFTFMSVGLAQFYLRLISIIKRNTVAFAFWRK